MSNSKKDLRPTIAVMVALLLATVFRVDPWWGQDTPLIFGWLNIRMVYYLAVFGIGYALVIYTVLKLWKDPKEL